MTTISNFNTIVFIIIRKSKLKKSHFLKKVRNSFLLHAKPNLQFVYVIESLGKSVMSVKENQELM